MIFAGMKIVFSAFWFVRALCIVAIRICFLLLRLLCRGIWGLISRWQEKTKGYEVRYYG